MSQIQIRSITAEDVEGFHTCLDAVSRERKYLGHVKAPPIEATRKWLMKAMEQGEIRLVAVDGSKIVGWCDIELDAREGFEHTGKLGTGVLKEYRRQGIGNTLVEKALEEARDRGIERVELDVYASNTAAISLYEKFKFQVEGRRRRARKLDGRYDDIIVMALFFGE